MALIVLTTQIAFTINQATDILFLFFCVIALEHYYLHSYIMDNEQGYIWDELITSQLTSYKVMSGANFKIIDPF